MKAVIDTNILVSALKSNKGYSFELIERMFKGEFIPVISVPLVFEYEEQLKSHFVPDIYKETEIEGFIDSICDIAYRQKIYYLWRPILSDYEDDHVLEVALSSGCNYIVTFNEKDFRLGEPLGITAIKPGDFIRILERSEDFI